MTTGTGNTGLGNTGTPGGTSVVGDPTQTPAQIKVDDSFKSLRVFKHLLPRAKAWLLVPVDKALRLFFEGLSGPIGSDIQAYVDLAYLNKFPQTTQDLDAWEFEYGITNYGTLSEQERRDRLAAAETRPGGQSPSYLQNRLQAAGFNVYVHEWWDPANVPPVDDKTCVTPRNPNDYLRQPGETGNHGLELGEPVFQMGEPEAQLGNSFGAGLGYPLTGTIVVAVLLYEARCGAQDTRCGNATARCGNYDGYTEVERTVQLPTDPDKYPYFVYIGAQTFPELAVVQEARRAELETLVLKLAPAHLWVGMLVTYN